MTSKLQTILAAIHSLPSMSDAIMRQIIGLEHNLTVINTIDWNLITPDLKRAEKLSAAAEHIDLARTAEWLQRNHVSVMTILDQDYPRWLKEIASPPPILYVRGSRAILAHPGLAVVGTRQPTSYGLDMTKQLITGLANSGLTVISGLAEGIDGAAHQTALDVGLPTVAVLGSGADRMYPWRHRQLAEDILNSGGAVISEFPLGAGPERFHFPRRNRIISGLSKAVLLIEAGGKSGALITAKFAVDQNRDVLALPGPVTSDKSIGPNNWIRLGAKLVTSASDILEVFNLSQTALPLAPAAPATTDPIELAICEILSSGPGHIDEIVKKSRLDTSVVTATVTLLEIRGRLTHLGGMIYTLAS